MAPRRAARRGGNTTRANSRRAPAGIRKNTCTRQQHSRLGQEQERLRLELGSEITNDPTSESEEPQPSTPQYSISQAYDSRSLHPTLASGSHTPTPRNAFATPSAGNTKSDLGLSQDPPINLRIMRELLRSHERDIVERVVDQLNA